MDNNQEQLEQSSIPEKWQGKYILKRYGEEPIEITQAQRYEILEAYKAGEKLIQIRNYTIHTNTIKSIDPKWGELNIPPRPKQICEYIEGNGNVMKKIVKNQEELDEWDRLFKNKLYR